MTDTRTIPERCQATAKDGKQCGAKPRPNRPYCLWHDDADDAQEKRRLISHRERACGRCGNERQAA